MATRYNLNTIGENVVLNEVEGPDVVDDSRAQLLRALAFSCHVYYRDSLREIITEASEIGESAIPYHTFADYFVKELLTEKSDDVISRPLIAPYFEKIALDIKTVPENVHQKPPYRGAWKLNTPEVMRREYHLGMLAFKADFDFSLTVQLYNAWKGAVAEEGENWELKMSECLSVFDRKAFNEYLKGVEEVDDDDDRASLFEEFYFGGHYNLYQITSARNTEYVPVYVYYPIATSEFFYGFLLVAYTASRGDFRRKKNGVLIKKLNEVGEKKANYVLSGIKRIARETYLPVLVLFHHSQYEKKLARLIDKNGEELPTFLECVTKYLEKARKSSDFLERQLGQLWGRRITSIKGLIEGSPNKKGVSQSLRRTLKFAEYFVASPGMIKVITQACKINVTRKEKYLPSVLIVGGPGSGKDVIAGIIQLFSSDFWDADPLILNMASFKPEAISAPLISGIDINLNNTSFRVESVLLRLSKESDDPRVVILDELNSLDIEAQGALLRIIENKRITPLGAVIPEKVDCLIIGVMNEDPQDLLIEYNLRGLLKKNQYIGILGAHLFGEIMKRVKRLREDLYFRLTREGEIKLLDLNSRRPDIPVLSYVYVLSELKKGVRKDVKILDINRDPGNAEITFNFDLEAFEVLMDKTIDWTGNVRQLQLICKAISQEALDSAVINTSDLAAEVRPSMEVSVTRLIADKVLRDYDLIKR